MRVGDAKLGRYLRWRWVFGGQMNMQFKSQDSMTQRSEHSTEEKLGKTLSCCICVRWHIHVCDVAHSCVWRGTFMCVTWHSHVCDVAHLCVWRGTFMCVTWHIHVCDVAHACVWHACVYVMTHMCVKDARVHVVIDRCVTHACVCVMTHICVTHACVYVMEHNAHTKWICCRYDSFFLMGTVALYRVCSTGLR